MFLPDRESLVARRPEVQQPQRAVRDRVSGAVASSGLRSVIDPALRSPGRPLDATTRAYLEPRFGHDFSGVRVHTDPVAGLSARTLNAVAYTVGEHIFFQQGDHVRSGPHGARVLEHELTHVLQQRAGGSLGSPSTMVIGDQGSAHEGEADAAAHEVSSSRANPAVAVSPAPISVQRQSSAPPATRPHQGRTVEGFFANVFRGIASIFGPEPDYSDTDLQDYLKVLDALHDIEGDDDSDNKARAVVGRWRKGSAAFSLTPNRKTLILKELMTGFVSNDDQIAIMDLLEGSPDADLSAMFATVPQATIEHVFDSDRQAHFKRVVAGHQVRTGPLPKRDVLAGTQSATPEQHLVVESILNPGSTLTPAAPPSAGGAAPPPTFHEPPAMTGLPPAPGAHGAFEQDMIVAMKEFVKKSAAKFRALKAAGPAGFPIQQANSIAVAAQKTTEGYFAPYIRTASRTPSGEYHPGAYSLTSKLGDQSTVPITDSGVTAAPGVTPRPGRIGWTDYWMAQDFTGGDAVIKKYHCSPTLREPDGSEFARVRDLFATDPANRPDIDDTIHSWPAEATGGVNIQPYQKTASENAARTVRWDTYTTLMHEMMHVLQHPNYERTYRLIGGQGTEILKEGMADVMREDLWDGPGQHHAQLAAPDLASLRRQVEGGSFPYDSSVVFYHPNYSSMSDARKIVDGVGPHPGVGIANAKAAFFLGHTELLGLGAGTHTAGHASLNTTAGYGATDSAQAEILVAVPGESLSDVQSRTNAVAGGILDAQSGVKIAPGEVLTGRKLRIHGIRFVRSIAEDTLSTIASQNGVSEPALVAANRLPAGTLGTHQFPVGTRVLIPIRSAP